MGNNLDTPQEETKSSLAHTRELSVVTPTGHDWMEGSIWYLMKRVSEYMSGTRIVNLIGCTAQQDEDVVTCVSIALGGDKVYLFSLKQESTQVFN